MEVERGMQKHVTNPPADPIRVQTRIFRRLGSGRVLDLLARPLVAFVVLNCLRHYYGKQERVTGVTAVKSAGAYWIMGCTGVCRLCMATPNTSHFLTVALFPMIFRPSLLL
jgi:hypothetical protein